jgi:serine/threonine-protein kinase
MRDARRDPMTDVASHEVAVLQESYRSGDVIAGKYRLEWEAQEGGMCHVWMAVNEALDLPVAIKFLRRELRCPALVGFLRREARVLAGLRHPAIVQIFDSGEIAPDHPFIVMERLEGEDLRQSLQRGGPWPAEDAVRLLLPIARSLCAAHEHGIVHRDLKPENILLARDDAGTILPKLLDFGVAKVDSEGLRAPVLDSNATGTVGYMAPEQAFALENLDHRADVWAFCAVLYEIISGSTPLSSESLDDMQRAHVQDAIAPLTASGVDGSLWSILERGLRVDPNERWSSMQALGQSLARWLVSRGVLEDVRGGSITTEWFDRSLSDTLPFPLIKVAKTRGHAVDGWALLRALASDAQGRHKRSGARSSLQ